MTEAEYRAHPALSQSGAKLLLPGGSPAEFLADLATERTDTEAFRFGRLVHALVLEPAEVPKRFSTGPDLSGCVTKDGKPAANPGATTEGKAIVAAWHAANPDVAVVSAQTMADAQACAASIVANQRWLELQSLAVEVACELPIVWQDAATGAVCKAMLDMVLLLDDGSVVVIDLKTYSGKWTPAGLANAVADWAYHRQAAHYLDAMASQGHSNGRFFFAFVRKTAPFESLVVEIDQGSILVGAGEMDAAKAVYAACVGAGNWPTAQEMAVEIGGRSVAYLPQTLALPRWYRGLGSELEG